MQVVILAGGMGTRLRPLTLSTPKPIISILGKPYLYYQLKYLKRQGIGKALLLVGYLGEQIKDYFGQGRDIGMDLDYSEEKELMGTGGALKLAEEKISGDFIVINGDSFLPIDYSHFESAFRRAGTEGIAAVYRDLRGATGVTMNVALSPEGLVVCYNKEGISPGLDYVDAGVAAFRKGVLKRISPGRVISLEKDVYPELIGEGELSGYITRSRFYDIGTRERIKEMEAWLRSDYLADTVQGDAPADGPHRGPLPYRRRGRGDARRTPG